MVNSNPVPEDSEKVVSILCVLCKEEPFTPGCRTCDNVLLYRASSAERDALRAIEDREVKDVLFPGPAIVKHNSIYGNYVVASREIEKGEIICLEKALLVSPYGPSYTLPLCTGCCLDIGLSVKNKCSKCKWSVCGIECQENALHAENECEIFAKAGVRQKRNIDEYFSIETLRCLLLRKKSPKKWKQVMKFEAHMESRTAELKARETRNFIVDFIRNKCQLKEFDEQIIDQVVGVLSVNTFFAHKEIHRYASLLFDKVTLLAHDCDPNTSRKLIRLTPEELKNHVDEYEFEYEEDCHTESGIRMEIRAARSIQPGEMITTQYLDVEQPVQVRRQELRELFYFDCSCSKCLNQLLEQDLKIGTSIDSINNNNNNNNNNNENTQTNNNNNVQLLTSIQTCDGGDVKSI